MKFKSIFLTFIFIIFVLATNSFATTFTCSNKHFNVTFTYNDELQYSVSGTLMDKYLDYTYKVKDDSDYKIIPFVRERNGRIFYCYFKVPVNSSYRAIYVPSGVYDDYFYFDFICDKNFYYYDGEEEYFITTDTKRIDNSSTYPMCNTYDLDGKTLLFQCPVVGVVVPALETAEQIPEAIMITLKILIPVGLIVLVIGLIIYLIKRVIYSTQ